MPNITSVLNAEIARVARKELRGDAKALKIASARYRADIAELKRRLQALEKQVKGLGRGISKAPKPLKVEDGASRRWRPAGFKKLREKLELSAAEMGELLDCSALSVYRWEQGKARPRAAQIEAIAAARMLGKREVRARLAQTAS